MQSLPMAPDACSLSSAELDVQLHRYRTVGESARAKRRDAMRLELVAGPDVTDAAIETLVATEQTCCPFFAIEWQPESRWLTIAVSNAEDGRALDVIAQALGMPGV